MADAGYDPPMFNGEFDPRAEASAPVVLSDPGANPCSAEAGFGLQLILDPAGTSPDPLPIGDVAEVTGIFDHPAARGCWSSWIEPVSEPAAASCRAEFVVTRIE